MDNEQFAELSAWVTEAGLAGQSESAILAGLCEREAALGLRLARALVLIDTLHPIYEGRAFRWTRAQKETTFTEYGRSDDDLSRWQRSPFSRLEESGEPHEQGGDVLKLIGDGVLAIFTADDRGRACDAALAAALAARRGVAAVNQRRTARGLATTDIYLGLHIGDVFYGNVGSKERLDFTVVGPAVNEVSRIAAMCRSVDQPLLVSSDFASALGEARSRLVSVGRYALRGVGRAQDLFTLE
jgi:class 3 adenylate cyclase